MTARVIVTINEMALIFIGFLVRRELDAAAERWVLKAAWRGRMKQAALETPLVLPTSF